MLKQKPSPESTSNNRIVLVPIVLPHFKRYFDFILSHSRLKKCNFNEKAPAAALAAAALCVRGPRRVMNHQRLSDR